MDVRIILSRHVAVTGIGNCVQLHWTTSASTHAATPCVAVCIGPQRLGLCSGCFLSPACKLDAGGSLGQAWYGAHCGPRPAVLPLVHVHRLLWIQLPSYDSRPRVAEHPSMACANMIANSRKATPSGSTRRASKRIQPTRVRTHIFMVHRTPYSTMEFLEHAIWFMRRAVGKCLCKYSTPAQDQLDINTWLDRGEPEDEEDVDVDGGSGGQFASSSSRRFSPQGRGHASASRMSY